MRPCFATADSEGSRLQVVPTDDANWPQEDLKTGEPAPATRQHRAGQRLQAPAASPVPAPAPTPELRRAGSKRQRHTRRPSPHASRERPHGAGSPSAPCSRSFSAAGGWYGKQWWTAGRFVVWTDDAYVAHNTTLASKVAGYLSAFRSRIMRRSEPAM